MTMVCASRGMPQLKGRVRVKRGERISQGILVEQSREIRLRNTGSLMIPKVQIHLQIIRLDVIGRRPIDTL